MHQKVDFAQFAAFLFEDADKFFSDNFALLFRFADAFQAMKETVFGVNQFEVHPQPVAENLDDFGTLVFAHQTVVHQHTCQLIADGTMDKCGGNGAVYAAAHGTQYFFVADFVFDFCYHIGNKACHRPVAFGTCDFEQEIGKDFVAVLGMDDFGVKLYAVDPLLLVAERGDGAGSGGCKYFVRFGSLGYKIGVRHPANTVRHIAEKGRTLVSDFLLAVFARRSGAYDAAFEMGNQLGAVANTEHGDAEGQNTAVDGKRVFFKNAVGSSRKNNPDRIDLQDRFDRSGVGQKFAVNAEIPDSANNQLIVLPAEVQYDNGLMGLHAYYPLVE